MGWITPVINWVASNVLKPSDLNRIEGNILELNTIKEPTIPTGVIVMWSGGYTDIPTGWALCNGSNGTPNLQDRFVMGATGEADHKTTGGANSVPLTEANLASHTHGDGTLSADSGGIHSHSGSANSDGSHGHTGSTNSAGSHTHDVKIPFSSTEGESGGYGYQSFYRLSKTEVSSSAGSHTHSLSINSGGSHTHSLSINNSYSHTHGVSGSTGSAGSGTAHENRPAFYKLAFIMKL